MSGGTVRIMQVSAAMTHISVRIGGIQHRGGTALFSASCLRSLFNVRFVTSDLVDSLSWCELEVHKRVHCLKAGARDDEAARARNCKMKLLADMQKTAVLSSHTQSFLQ